MASGAFIIIGALVAIFIGFAMIISSINAKKRREAFRSYATSKGWTYAERDDRWGTHFQGSPFGQGHSIKSRNVLTGQYDARGMVAFDYVYYTTESSTDANGHTTQREEAHAYAIVALDAGVRFPRLSVTPEHFLGRLVGHLLNKDIELESEEFNRAFTVTCEDRKFATDILHPRMMETLLGFRDIGWEFNGTWILAYEPGQNDIPELERRLGALDAVLDGVPDFVWREEKGPTS